MRVKHKVKSLVIFACETHEVGGTTYVFITQTSISKHSQSIAAGILDLSDSSLSGFLEPLALV